MTSTPAATWSTCWCSACATRSIAALRRRSCTRFVVSAMFSNWRKGIIRTFGARIAGWYFALFAAGALVVLLIAGVLLQASLARRDRDALLAALVRYVDAYTQGGVTVLDGL